LDTDHLNGTLSGDRVCSFLKREAFYLLIVFVVAVLTMTSSIASLLPKDGTAVEEAAQPAERPRPAIEPIDRRRLAQVYKEAVETLARTRPRAVVFPVLVSLLDRIALVLGSAVFLALAVRWIIRGRMLASKQPYLSPPPWGLWDVLKLAAVFSGGGVLFRIIFRVNPINPFGSSGLWIAQIFASVLMVGVMAHIGRVERGAPLSRLGLRRDGIGRGIGLGLVAFLAIQPLLFLAERTQFFILRNAPMVPLQDTLQGMLRMRSATTLALSSFVAVLIAPVSEEMLFRGFLQPALRHWMAPAMAVLTSAAFFAAGHMDLYNMAPLFVLGLALGYLYHRTHSLVAPITLHVVFNGMTVLAIFAHRSVAASIRVIE